MPEERLSSAASVAVRLGSPESPVPVIQNRGTAEIASKSRSSTVRFISGAFGSR
jgi:hypothetical protein